MTTRTLIISLVLAVTTLLSTASQAWWGDPWHGYNGYNGWGPMHGYTGGDVGFNMNFRGRGHGRGYGYGRGYSYGYPYYAPVAYYPPVAYYAPPPVPAPAPVVIEQPVVIDSDNDSIADTRDLCPDTPAGTEVEFTGCPKDQPITLRGVNFKLDSAELTPESSDILDVVANTLSSHTEVTVEVGGHTDSQGDDAYNLDLSARRASTVRDYLITHGVPAANLTSAGYGETRLIDMAQTPGAHAINRRVELIRTDISATQVTQQ